MTDDTRPSPRGALDPGAAQLLKTMREADVPMVHESTPDAARAAMHERRHLTQLPPDLTVPAEDLTLPGPAGGIPVRLYRPPGARGTLPALVYYHGGGWTIGDLEVFDALCRDLCRESGAAVASVEYRLGPEHRFPAAVEDSLAALDALRDRAGQLGLDPARLAVGGDSAGGNLAAVTALLARDKAAAPPLAAQLLIYPSTDMRGGYPSIRDNAEGYFLELASVEWFYDHYLDVPERREDWHASPLLAPDLSGLPSALVLTAGFDPLRDEGRAFADALSAAGTPAQYVCFERQIHGFVTMTRISDEPLAAIDLAAGFLRRTLG